DLQMINYLIDNEIPFVIVLTKADKLKPTARKERMAALADEIPYFEDIHCIPFSAVTGEGVDDLKAIIEEIREDWYARAENGSEEEDIPEETPDDEDDTEPPTGFLTPNRNR
ncbi:MAG: YihA family ribosome biogenesis GTP-binding protein, partial [Ruminococcus sp.]|nr:YihA family ribosome biogenesis GTP-binding protein [Ruminococcus sp.]